MKSYKNIIFVASIGLILGAGCNSDNDKNVEDNNKSQTVTDINQTQNADKTKDINETEDTKVSTENNSTTTDEEEIAVGYTTGEGILIETKADGTKRAWVNTRTEDCLIYRPKQQGGGHVYEGGKKHCESLNTKKYANITSWRLPEEEEAVYIMAHATAEDGLLYPDDNPNCYYMATNTKYRYVYSTAYTTQHIYDPTGAFTDEKKSIAGIRCVADQ